MPTLDSMSRTRRALQVQILTKYLQQDSHCHFFTAKGNTANTLGPQYFRNKIIMFKTI